MTHKNYKFNYACLLFIILALGFSLRLYNFSEESLWFDEACTLQSAEQPSLGLVFESIGELEGNPPLYYLFMQYWIRGFGTTEFSLRFPSIIFGTLSIFMIYFLGKELFDKKTGIISSLIMSVSMLNILYSQEARTYSLFILLAIISIFSFIKLLKKDRISPLYIISTLLALYTHYLAILLIILQILTYFIFNKQFKLKAKNFLITLAVIFLLYIPGVIMLYFQMHSIQSALHGALFLKLGIPNFIARLGGFIFFIPFLIIIFILLVFKLLNIECNSILKKMKFNQTLFFIFLMIFLLAYFILSNYITKPVFIIRYTLFIYPLFYVLFAKGFLKLKKSYKIVIAILFIAVTIFSLANFYFNMPRKEQWKDTAEFIEKNFSDGEIVIIIHKDMQYPLSYYLNKNLPLIGVGTYLDPSDNYEELIKLRDKIKSKTGYWLVLSHAYKSQGIYQEYFNENHNLIDEEHFIDIDIYHYLQ